MQTARRSIPTSPRAALALTAASFTAIFAFDTSPAAAQLAANCDQTSVGITPLTDLGPGLYLNTFQGGLYPDGLNTPPPAHFTAGANRAQSIIPRNPAGQPDPDGHYVLLSIGMSNTSQEFCCHPGTFMGQAAADPRVEADHLVILNGAAGGQTASTWDDPADPNYNRIRDNILAPRGLSELQVAAAWVKVANAQPNSALPNADADAYRLVEQIGDVVRALKSRYPNLRVVLLSSRIYAGYASTALNPEPYAFESGLAVKWVIEAQIRQMAGEGIDPRAGDLNPGTVAPWIGWAAYLWADGLNPRSDGLIWECADFDNDGVHPSTIGETKVGTMLLEHMLASPFSRPWFRARSGDCPTDWNNDGIVNAADYGAFLNAYFRDLAEGTTRADFDANGSTNAADVGAFLTALLAARGPCPA